MVLSKVKEKKHLTVLAALTAILISQETALACSVCYGAAESPILDGMNWSILFMLVLTYLLLGSFAAFFIYLKRREKLFCEEPPRDAAALESLQSDYRTHGSF
jgi:heme/copper-type cytochrome/quinol oxidase subunit 2